jgi:hypothetical protein
VCYSRRAWAGGGWRFKLPQRSTSIQYATMRVPGQQERADIVLRWVRAVGVASRDSAPGRYAAVTGACSAAVAAETPGAVAASGSGAIGDCARAGMRRGMDGLTVVVKIGLVVIEVGFVRGRVGVGVGRRAVQGDEGAEEEWGDAANQSAVAHFLELSRIFVSARF